MNLTIENLENKAEINAERMEEYRKKIEEYKNAQDEINSEISKKISLREKIEKAIDDCDKQLNSMSDVMISGNSNVRLISLQLRDEYVSLKNNIDGEIEKLHQQHAINSSMIQEYEEAIEHSKVVLNKIIEICEENIEEIENEKDKSNKSKNNLKPIIEKYTKITNELEELQEFKNEGIVTRKDLARIEELEKEKNDLINMLNKEIPNVKKMLEKAVYEDLSKDDNKKIDEANKKINENEELIKNIKEFINDFKNGKTGITINTNNTQNNIEKEQLENNENEEIQRKITKYIDAKKSEKEETAKQETNDDNKDINNENNTSLQEEKDEKNKFKIIKKTELSHANKQEVEDILNIDSFDPNGKTEELDKQKDEVKKKNNYEDDIKDIFAQTNLSINSHNKKEEKEPVTLTPSSKVKMREDKIINDYNKELNKSDNKIDDYYKEINKENNAIKDYLNAIRTDSRIEQIEKKVKKNVPKEKKQGLFKRAYENIKYYFFGTDENVDKWEKEELEKNKDGRTR